MRPSESGRAGKKPSGSLSMRFWNWPCLSPEHKQLWQGFPKSTLLNESPPKNNSVTRRCDSQNAPCQLCRMSSFLSSESLLMRRGGTVRQTHTSSSLEEKPRSGGDVCVPALVLFTGRRRRRWANHQQKCCKQKSIDPVSGTRRHSLLCWRNIQRLKAEHTEGLHSIASNSPLAERPSSHAKCGSGAREEQSEKEKKRNSGEDNACDQPLLPKMKSGLLKSQCCCGKSSKHAPHFFCVCVCELIY